MSDLTRTPTSPPAPPVIPIGLSTQIGLAAAGAQFVACLVTVFLNGDHSQETILTLGTATVTLVTVLGGRFAQAYAIYRDRPSAAPAQTVNTFTIPEQPVVDEIGGDGLWPESDLVPLDRAPDPSTIPLDVGDAHAAPGADR